MSPSLIAMMVVAVVAAFFVVVPSLTWLRRVSGYMVLADLVGSMYVISTFASTGSVHGLVIAVFAAIGLSLSFRVFRALFGYERLYAGTDEVGFGSQPVRYTRWSPSIRLVAAEILTQCAAWIFSFVKAVFTYSRVQAPSPLRVQWMATEGWLTKVIRQEFDRSYS